MINDFSEEAKNIAISYKSTLKNAGIDVIEIPYNPYQNKTNIDATGIYINYLEVGNTIILPTYNLENDDETVKRFKEIFPSNNIQTLESSDLAKNGGVLNCITWNILKAI